MIHLLVQSESFQDNKIKAILKTGEDPTSKLQEEHCIEFQLVVKAPSSPKLLDRIISVSSSYKTKLGKDWYEFDVEGLTKVITVFLESGNININLNIISNIFGFSFNLIPLIKKEVKIEPISSTILNITKENKLVEKEEIESLLKDLDITPQPIREKSKRKK